MKTPRHLPPGLSGDAGPRFWKSLEEFSQRPDFLPYLHREFPEYAAEWNNGIDRRRFLQLIGASLALAGLTSCSRQPQEKIVPYVQKPLELTPGEPLYYATTFPEGGYGKGVIVRSYEARPTKIEGNPDHPASLGASDLFMQASVLGLYDPDRSQVVRRGEDISNWTEFIRFARERVAAHEQDRGAGLFLLTGANSSPAFRDQLLQLHTRFPNLSWCEADSCVPVCASSADGTPAEPIFDFAQAEVVVSFDSDFLFQGPGNLVYAKAFSGKRRDPARGLSRFYALESTPTVTGAKADVRWRRKPSEIVALVRDLADVVVNNQPGAPQIQQLASELQSQRGKSIVIAGDYLPAAAHALVYEINRALGNMGTTVRYLAAAAPPAPMRPLADFVQAMARGEAKTLLIAGLNPIYDFPADLGLAAALKNVSHAVHLGLYDDETGTLCDWHLPEKHYLEAWGDILAVDGTPSLIQPLIAPLYPDAATLSEVLSAFIDTPSKRDYDIIHDFWAGRFVADAENSWNRSLNRGVLVGLRPDALPPVNPVTDILPPDLNPPAPVNGLEIIFRPDPSVLDGRYANNAWLQELPRPLTKLTWDNAALLSPQTAAQGKLQNGDIVRIVVGDRSVEAPVWIQPGQADDTVAVHLGYGRWRAGAIGNGVGFNATALRSMKNLWSASGVTLQATGRTHLLAVTQDHFSMDGRGLVQVQTLAEFATDPGAAKLNSPAPAPAESLYPAHEYKDYAWAMSIDLGSCLGCNACIVACQAENNIPVVGREQVLKSREMHWIRVDRYFEGAPEDPRIHFQPVPCMQCEDAPCEVVCPVAATTHSSEGLNEMTYNRCVGTRYCSNNCPYKVRRFNFLQYSDQKDATLALQKNPDVTIRSRGVMEKCTYCVQRIEEARIRSQKEMRSIRDGEIITACQSACPADAIVFGNRNDPDSRVARLKAQPRDYGLLAELNTRPRTTYLAKIINMPTSA
jgi:molybdopterin-containing oxidoreductase family iron-sulfur binding subunit